MRRTGLPFLRCIAVSGADHGDREGPWVWKNTPNAAASARTRHRTDQTITFQAEGHAAMRTNPVPITWIVVGRGKWFWPNLRDARVDVIVGAWWPELRAERSSAQALLGVRPGLTL